MSENEPKPWDEVRALAQSLIPNPQAHEPEDDEEEERAAGREWYCPCGNKNMTGASVCENAPFGADPDGVASEILHVLPRLTERTPLTDAAPALVAALRHVEGLARHVLDVTEKLAGSGHARDHARQIVTECQVALRAVGRKED